MKQPSEQAEGLAAVPAARNWDFAADGRFRPDDPCELHNWYDAVAHLTFPSTWFAVSAAEARAIVALNQARRQIGWLQRNMSADEADYPKGERADPRLALSAEHAEALSALERRIHNHVLAFPSGAFVRLSTRSPKDAPLFLPGLMRTRVVTELGRLTADEPGRYHRNQALAAAHRAFISALRVRGGRQAIDLLAASQRVCMDLQRAQMVQEGSEFACQCVVRGWDERVLPEREVRAFVSDGVLCAATQYHKVLFVPALDAARATVESVLREMHARLQAALPNLDTFTFDVAFCAPESGGELPMRCVLIEINHPPPIAGTALFNWETEDDRQVLQGQGRDGDSFELRLLSATSTRAELDAELEGFGPAVVEAIRAWEATWTTAQQKRCILQ